MEQFSAIVYYHEKDAQKQFTTALLKHKILFHQIYALEICNFSFVMTWKFLKFSFVLRHDLATFFKLHTMRNNIRHFKTTLWSLLMQ